MNHLSLNLEHLSCALCSYSFAFRLTFKKLLECDGVVVLGVVRAENQGHPAASSPSE